MSPPPDDSSPSELTNQYPPNEFTAEERKTLLQLAHESIVSSFEGHEIPLDPPSTHLGEPRGVFTTIYLHGNLRGCVGLVFPVSSLYRNVAESARSAAFEDTRFPSVTRGEASQLQISLSILSTLNSIAPEAIEIGRHGLLISTGSRRGLLLPQVPTEHGWDRIIFLEQTCRKAGLPPDAWKTGAKIEAFTAEVFRDD